MATKQAKAGKPGHAHAHAAIPLPTKEEVDAARAAAKKMVDKARALIILDHPFFATVMLKHPMTETMRVPTLAVSPRGDIFYNPFFLKDKSVDEVKFGIAHEIMHYVSNHAGRRGSRDPKKWNWAGDAWINDTLKQAGFTLIPGVVDVPGSAERTVEDIYASIPEDGGGSGEGGGNGAEGGGGDPIGDDIEYGDNGGGEEVDGSGRAPSDRPLSAAEMQEIDAQRKIEVAEAAQVAKMKGKLPGVLSKFAAETIESKTPWHEILERYMTEHKQSETSWARANKRYMPSYYMPHTDSEDAMGEIVCQVDISGSVSKQEISHYNGHIKRIIEQCKPTKVHVIYTDTQVQHHKVYDNPEDVQIEFYSGGGTDMTAGVRWVEENDIEPAVMVTLTDGYSPWPAKAPDFPTVWCISSKEQSPVGVNVHFELE
jgi:predicted metal-dependent peptidase